MYVNLGDHTNRKPNKVRLAQVGASKVQTFFGFISRPPPALAPNDLRSFYFIKLWIHSLIFCHQYKPVSKGGEEESPKEKNVEDSAELPKKKKKGREEKKKVCISTAQCFSKRSHLIVFFIRRERRRKSWRKPVSRIGVRLRPKLGRPQRSPRQRSER